MGEISPILHKCFQRNSKEDCSPTHSRWQPDPNPKTQQRRWKNGNHRRSSLTTRDAKILAKSEPIESYADKVSPNQRNAVSCTGSRNRKRTLRKNEWNLNRVWSWVNKTLSTVVHCVGQMCHRTVSNEKQGGTGCELCRTHTHTHTQRFRQWPGYKVGTQKSVPKNPIVFFAQQQIQNEIFKKTIAFKKSPQYPERNATRSLQDFHVKTAKLPLKWKTSIKGYTKLMEGETQ